MCKSHLLPWLSWLENSTEKHGNAHFPPPFSNWLQSRQNHICFKKSQASSSVTDRPQARLSPGTLGHSPGRGTAPSPVHPQEVTGKAQQDAVRFKVTNFGKIKHAQMCCRSNEFSPRKFKNLIYFSKYVMFVCFWHLFQHGQQKINIKYNGI